MMAQSVSPAVACNDICSTPSKKGPAAAQQLGLLALPDLALEDIFHDLNLSTLASARKSCHALYDVVTRPAVMLSHLQRATRTRPLPACQAGLSQCMQRQIAALRHLETGACKPKRVDEDQGAVLDVAETPAGERVSLTRPFCFAGMRIYDANGAALWQVRTALRESFAVPPKLAGDASAILYLVHPHPGAPQSLYLSRAGAAPTALLDESTAVLSHARFAPYDSRLVTVQAHSPGDTIRCFDAQGLETHAWSGANPGRTVGIAYADDQTSLVSSHRNSSVVRLWDVRKSGSTSSIACAIDAPAQLVFTPDSQRLFIGGQGGLQVWDRRMGQAQTCFNDRRCHEIAIAPDGLRIATKEEAYGDGDRAWRPRLRVYDAFAWQAPLFDDKSASGAMRFTNDGTGLYVQGKYSGWFFDFTAVAN